MLSLRVDFESAIIDEATYLKNWLVASSSRTRFSLEFLSLSQYRVNYSHELYLQFAGGLIFCVHSKSTISNRVFVYFSGKIYFVEIEREGFFGKN